MRLHFLGANRQVTGSRYLLETGATKTLVDCGMFQERAWLARNWEESPVPPAEVDALLLTHAHLDHCGLIPRFVQEGYEGSIFATPPSIDLARLVLEDSARIQDEDAAYKRRRHEREGRKGRYPEIPLYTKDDAAEACKRFKPVKFDQPFPVGEDLEATYRVAGHILGSAMIEIVHRPSGRRIVFSGDIGQWDRPLIRNPSLFETADYVVMESTYGDRDHAEGNDPEAVLDRVINDTVKRGGNVLIPTFAIDRAQELLYHISRLVNEKRIPRLTTFLDSPMAISATTIYKRFKHMFDDETKAMYDRGEHPFQYKGLHFVRTSGESRAINSIRGSCIVLAGSGMCTGGRIKHHLARDLSRPECTVLFAGYQAHGTLGRHILSGAETVRIHGRKHHVKAEIDRVEGLSAHADRRDLLRWLAAFKTPPKKLFLTHGEEDVAGALGEHVRETMGWDVAVPEYGEVVELA